MTACEKAIRYLLAKMDEESGDVMTLPVLQKLLYYSQGFSLAMTGKPLFEEDFEVWQMGPVIPALFEKYGKEPGFRILNSSETGDPGLTADEKEGLDQVYLVYGQFFWLETAGPGSRGSIDCRSSHPVRDSESRDEGCVSREARGERRVRGGFLEREEKTARRPKIGTFSIRYKSRQSIYGSR